MTESKKTIEAPAPQELDLSVEGGSFLKRRRRIVDESDLIPLAAPYPVACQNCGKSQKVGNAVLFDKLTRTFLCTGCGVG